jgi:putative hydrolase of the HAD superfamily
MKTTWIFDLDNTLHDADAHLFPRINAAMQHYIETHLKLEPAAASALRQHYWQRYGATLLGLQRHHAVDPHHFLHETHDFPDFARLIVFHPAVKGMLRRLPGQKILYSNSPARYARSVLDSTGMTPFFAAVYTVENTRFQPKPSLAGLRMLLRKEKLDARHCVMVDDHPGNLASARRLGLKTIWIGGSACKRPACADLCLTSVLELSRHAHRFAR